MRTSRSSFGSLGHPIDKKKCLFATDGVFRDYKILKGKPSLKEDAFSSILSYVPEKKVRQAINAGTPVAVSKDIDRVVSSALASTVSGGSLAMFETLSSSEEVPCCGSNRNGRMTPSDSISNSKQGSLYRLQ